MYQNMNLEQIKTFLKHVRQDIIVTKITRNIIVGEYHAVGIMEIFKTVKALELNSLSLSSIQYFWLKDSTSDILIFLCMLSLGMAWYSYQINLNDLYETEKELGLEQNKRFFLK